MRFIVIRYSDHFAMRFNFLILFFGISVSVVFSRTWDILWERNYCNSTLPNGLIYPFNTNCSLCISDQLRLYTPNPRNFENIYRVQTEQEMVSCDATNALNILPTVFNSEIVFTLINSGDTDEAFNFYLGEEIFFISTSNGTEASAKNDLSLNEGSCLQFSFVLLPSGQNCGNFNSCEMKSIFTDEFNKIGCNSYHEPIESRNVTQSTTSTDYPGFTTTENNTTSIGTIFPPLFSGVFKNYVVYIAISLFISLICITIGLLSVVLFRRVFFRRKQVLEVQHQLESGVHQLGHKNHKDSEKREELSKDSFEYIEP